MLILITSFLAGLLSSLSGLGGGIMIVPLLIYGFGVELPYAVGVSLLAVVATSITTTALLLPKGYTHLKLSLFLETGSVAGAIFGAKIAPFVPFKVIAFLFSLVLFYAAFQGFRGPPLPRKLNEESPNKLLDLSFNFQGQPYQTDNLFGSWVLMTVGGILAGLLGIGSGSFNVVILERLMGMPLLVATATSSSIIGMTAAGGAWTYWERGFLEPTLILSVVPGVVLGSFAGSFLMGRLSGSVIRYLFSTLVFFVGLRMFYGSL